MASSADIKWGAYATFEGPFYPGKCPYALPANAVEEEEQLLVLVTTEGGTYDAYNGYDVCISTSGLSQWCDKAPFFLVCKLLGAVAERDMRLLEPLLGVARSRGYSFKKNSAGGWRWFKGGTEVRSADGQRALYFAGASGNKNSFSLAQKEQAKEWAAAVSTVWENEEAQAIQRAYTIPRLGSFAMGKGKKVLLDSYKHDNAFSRAFRAAYISFAANNPTRAADAVEHASLIRVEPFGYDWLVVMLKYLTFHSKVAIYPHRYTKIRPVLERLYGVDLPDLAKDLDRWNLQYGFSQKGEESADKACTPKGLQQALLVLGYDIGPAGADGIVGKRTKAALKKFEADAQVPAHAQDGVPDNWTVPALLRVLRERQKLGQVNLSA